MYDLDDKQRGLVRDYAQRLQQTLIDVAGEAIDKLAPAEISWANGQADFAVNRRSNKEPDVPALRAKHELQGPVDHDVPVLAVKDAEGETDGRDLRLCLPCDDAQLLSVVCRLSRLCRRRFGKAASWHHRPVLVWLWCRSKSAPPSQSRIGRSLRRYIGGRRRAGLDSTHEAGERPT